MSEIYSLLQRVPGVKHVLDVKLSQRPVNPGKEVPSAGDEEEEAQAPPQVKAELPLTPIEQRRFAVDADTLLCSLEHEIKITEL